MIRKISSQLLAKTAVTLMAAAVIIAGPVNSFAAQQKPFVPADPILPLSEVREGMKAEIRTVLHGTKISRFSATPWV